MYENSPSNPYKGKPNEEVLVEKREEYIRRDLDSVLIDGELMQSIFDQERDTADERYLRSGNRGVKTILHFVADAVREKLGSVSEEVPEEVLREVILNCPKIHFFEDVNTFYYNIDGFGNRSYDKDSKRNYKRF